MELYPVSQGAEANVSLATVNGKRVIVKKRIVKSYRHKDLDKRINKKRMTQEYRCFAKCRKNGILCPVVYNVDYDDFLIFMEHIQGITLKRLIWTLSKRFIDSSSTQQLPQLVLAGAVGKAIAGVHNLKVIHGDLTTSNIMIRHHVDPTVAEVEKFTVDEYKAIKDSVHAVDSVTSCQSAIDTQVLSEIAPEHESIIQTVLHCHANPADLHLLDVVVLDFGLATQQANVEDMAVDLYVLERAFLSTHPLNEPVIEAILAEYGKHCTSGVEVLSRLEQVRQRGRKRDMLG